VPVMQLSAAAVRSHTTREMMCTRYRSVASPPSANGVEGNHVAISNGPRDSLLVAERPFDEVGASREASVVTVQVLALQLDRRWMPKA